MKVCDENGDPIRPEWLPTLIESWPKFILNREEGREDWLHIFLGTFNHVDIAQGYEIAPERIVEAGSIERHGGKIEIRFGSPTLQQAGYAVNENRSSMPEVESALFVRCVKEAIESQLN